MGNSYRLNVNNFGVNKSNDIDNDELNANVSRKCSSNSNSKLTESNHFRIARMICTIFVDAKLLGMSVERLATLNLEN